MSRVDADRAEDHDLQPTALTHVGPATAAVIERAPFDAADVRDRRVSYAELLAAGVDPGVATKLRREYSLVWSFEWVAGAHLAHRADAVAGLDPDQRAWIVASAGDGSSEGASDVLDAERAWRERMVENGEALAEQTNCERCGDPLVTFQLGDRRAVHCEGCGYAGVVARARTWRAPATEPAPEWW